MEIHEDRVRRFVIQSPWGPDMLQGYLNHYIPDSNASGRYRDVTSTVVPVIHRGKHLPETLETDVSYRSEYTIFGAASGKRSSRSRPVSPIIRQTGQKGSSRVRVCGVRSVEPAVSS